MEPTSWIAFLSNASKILSESLDHKETLDRVAGLAVPALGDWCDVYVLAAPGHPELTRVAVKGPERFRSSLESGGRPRRVRREVGGLPEMVAGKSVLIEPITDEMLRDTAADEADLALLRSVGLRSTLLVPLIARQVLIGVLILSMSESGRVFGAEERAVAEELAARAALAVDNARLYQERADGERKLRAILDHSPAIIYVADRDGRLVTVNREYEKRSGRGAAEILGKTLADILPAEDAGPLMAANRQVMDENRALQVESLVQEHGELRHWFSLKFPITSEDGAVLGVAGIATDVTEHKRAAEALRRSQENLAKIFRASTLGVSVAALDDGRFVEVNAACERMTGYRREELIGRSSVELDLWARPEERARAMEILARDGSVSGFAITMRDRHKVQREVLMSFELIELGGRACVLGLAHDITDMKRLQQRLESAQRLEALGRLAGGVAHDFNNLLTAIQGYSSVLMEAASLDETLRGSAGHIRRAAERAAALTEQLLVFGRQKVRPKSVVDVNGAVESVVGMLHRLIGEDVRLETALSQEAGCVEIDPGQLDQIILNLALNARDAMPSGGRLRIVTEAARSDEGRPEVLLRVEDEGVGMDEATREHIFEPFFTTKPVGRGSGLGLATVYGIVQQAGGRIVVASEPQRGARFDVFLPQVEPEVTAPEVEPAPSPAPEPRTLLVVEDDDSVREYICLVLDQAGYQVLAACDGEAALRLLADEPRRVDLLLTDIVMPNRNGRALANELRRDQPSLRVVYMSGYPGDTLERYDAIPPGDLFLQKPFMRDRLLSAVARSLRGE